MANTVKLCDMSVNVAAKVFQMLNPEEVTVKLAADIDKVTRIVTSVEPKELCYPEGWYYAKGYFTNKHNSTTGAYSAILMYDSDGEIWDLPYCTAD